MAVEITSREELEAWLEDKPREWAQVIAARAAFRVLPIAIDPEAYKMRAIDPRVALAVCRAISVSLGAARIPSNGFASDAAANASGNAEYVFRYAQATADYANSPGDASAAISAFWSVVSASSTGHTKANADTIAAQAVSLAAEATDAAAIWGSSSTDLNALESGINITELLNQPVWGERPDWFVKNWGNVVRWMSRKVDGFEIWREWYYGRLEGLPHAFADFDDQADTAFCKQILKYDDDWWSRPPAEVNADITALVDGLRNIEPPSEGELEQNSRAITFRPTANGQVGLNKQADPHKLDTSDDAALRHAEALAEANSALVASALGATQALDVAKPLENYIEALGNRLNGTIPSLLVARGEKLRRLIASRDNPSSSAIPFSENQEGALQDWMVAHNLLIGSDPYLADIEHMARGPDAPVVVLDLEALKQVIQSATEAGIPTVEAAEALEDSAANIPENALEGDRRAVQATEAVKNFIRGVGSSIKAHGWKMAIGAGGTGYAGAL